MSEVSTAPAELEGSETAVTTDPAASSSAPESDVSDVSTETRVEGDEPEGDRGDGRTPRGRFARSKESATTTEGTPAKVGDEANDAGEARADAAGEPGVEALEDPAAVAGTPFTVRHGGREIEVPGATLDATGRLTVAADGVQRFHAAIGKALEFEQQRESLRRDRTAVAHEKAVNDARYAGIATRFAELIKMREAGDEDAFAAWADKFWSDMPLMRERAEIDAERAALQLERRQNEPDPQERLAQQEQAAEAEVGKVIGELKAQPWSKVLGDEDWQQLFARVAQHSDVYFVEKEGTVYFREALFLSDAQQLAKFRASERTRKADDAKAFNQSRDPAKRAATPATVKAPAAPAPTPEVKQPRNWREWNALNQV